MSHSSTPESHVECWNEIAEEWGANHPYYLWRRHSDRVYRQLLERWLPEPPVETLLKTDLFDEAMAEGVFPLLDIKATEVVGIDVSSQILALAANRYRRLETVHADTRRLPFEDESFDSVVSLSTLDHFETTDDIVASLRELNRVLRYGGALLLTMDNLANPAVWLRNSLPFPWLHGLGIVPYYVGKTCRPHRLRNYVRDAGFEVVEATAIMHCPRVLAVAAARFLTHRSELLQNRFLDVLWAFERCETWPMRYMTGYFVALRAQKQ